MNASYVPSPAYFASLPLTTILSQYKILKRLVNKHQDVFKCTCEVWQFNNLTARLAATQSDLLNRLA